ncbi:MAG: hypothetical protein CTY25_03930 [Methylobacterium sp.]|nr:MAG: hypothetical protein CTY25_03930 [Methylobacterium sp.]
MIDALRQQTASGKGAAAIAPIDGPTDDHLVVSACLDRVDVSEDRIALTLRSDQREAEGAGPSNARLVIPCSLGFAQPYQRVVEAEGTSLQDDTTNRNARSRNRDRLIVAIHKARGWLDELTTGQASDIVEIAQREGKSRRNVSLMINLAFVAPDIIERLLNYEGTALTATALAQALPDGWEGQGKAING